MRGGQKRRLGRSRKFFAAHEHHRRALPKRPHAERIVVRVKGRHVLPRTLFAARAPAVAYVDGAAGGTVAARKGAAAFAEREMKTARPILGLTMGDPAGIGPEICLRALRESAVLAQCTPVLFGDAAVWKRVAQAAGIAGADCRVVAASELDGFFEITEPLIV